MTFSTSDVMDMVDCFDIIEDRAYIPSSISATNHYIIAPQLNEPRAQNAHCWITAPQKTVFITSATLEPSLPKSHSSTQPTNRVLQKINTLPTHQNTKSTNQVRLRKNNGYYRSEEGPKRTFTQRRQSYGYGG